jgi:DnaJ-class molecular chaperone
MNNNNKSPFDILGVGRFSTQKEIRRRYLELCKKYHPDVTLNHQVDFREITVAYELLTNHKKNNHIIASGGVNWEEAKQKSINTRLWTRNSYFVGFSIATFMILYLSVDKLKNSERERTLLPHERKRQEQVFHSSKETNDVNDSVPPWQAAGTTFREWRKK